jgi:hypothetical protein
MRHQLPAFVAAALLAAFTTPAMPAQDDPIREIQEIAKAIDEQMQEIDRLLLESGKRNQDRSKPKELLQKAAEAGTGVEQGIDQLIEKLTKLKNESGQPQQSEGEPQDKPQGQQRPQSGQQQGNRRENQNPDFVPQPPQGEQPGQQCQKPEPKPGEGQPQGGQESPDKPENRTGNRQPEPELGPGNPGQGDETWGELQPYVNFLKNRGSAPKVPERYRKYWEAYLKNRQAGSGK